MIYKKVFSWAGVAFLAMALAACGGSSSSSDSGGNGPVIPPGGGDGGSGSVIPPGGSGNGSGPAIPPGGDSGSGGGTIPGEGAEPKPDTPPSDDLVTISGHVKLGNGVKGGTVKAFCTDDLDFTQPLESQSPYLAKTESGTFKDDGGFSFTNLDVRSCQENLLFVLDAPGGEISHRDYGNSYSAAGTNKYAPFDSKTGYVVFKQEESEEHFMYAFAPKDADYVQLNLFTSVAAVMLGKSQREQNVVGASVEAINKANEAVRSVYLPEQDSLPVLLQGPVRARTYNKTVFSGTKAEQASWQAHLLLIAMRYGSWSNGAGDVGHTWDVNILRRSMAEAANAATDKLFTEEFDMEDFRSGVRDRLAREAEYRDTTKEDGKETPSYKWAMETELFPGY